MQSSNLALRYFFCFVLGCFCLPRFFNPKLCSGFLLKKSALDLGPRLCYFRVEHGLILRGTMVAVPE